jgi:hypothetical protein
MYEVEYIQVSAWGGGGGGGDAANHLYGLILRYFRHLQDNPDI